MASYSPKTALFPRLDCDFSGSLRWEAPSPRTDGWKGYCGDFVPDRKQKQPVRTGRTDPPCRCGQARDNKLR
jgi:hypothetical protein